MENIFMKTRNCFTIIELLLVAAVISVLFSLMLPAVQKSISQGKKRFCSSNLRQLSIASSLYSSGNDQYALPANFGSTTLGGYDHWLNYLLANNQATAESIQCPEMSTGDFFDPAGHDPSTGNIYKEASYIMNIIAPNNWNNALIKSSPAKTFGWGKNSTTPIKLQTAIQPSEKLYLLDAAKNLNGNHSGVNQFARTDYGIPRKSPTGSARWVGYYHRNGFNAVFGDGHIIRLLKSQPQQWAVSIEKN